MAEGYQVINLALPVSCAQTTNSNFQPPHIPSFPRRRNPMRSSRPHFSFVSQKKNRMDPRDSSTAVRNIILGA